MANKPLVTPRGVASYPHLTTPDTKFDEAGVYSTKLRFSGDDATEMRHLLDQLYSESAEQATKELREKGKRTKVRLGPEPYTELENGDIEVNFKMKASGTRKDGTEWTARPAIFDAAGKPLAGALKIGGGSVLKIAYEPNLYYVPALGAGVSLRLKAVQVIELVAWGVRDAAGFGFGEEEGFDSEQADESVFAGPSSDAPDDDFEDDVGFDEDDDEVEF